MKRRAAVSRCIALAIALVWAASALAELVVLYDSGRSWPIDRYLAPLLSGRDGEPGTLPPEPRLGPAAPGAILPIRSPTLTPGPVATRTFATPIPLAFFMIGSDARSLRWLARHHDELKRQGAVGLLVDASNEADLNAVANAAMGLPITPASGEDVAAALAIVHYPVAVTEGRIWQ